MKTINVNYVPDTEQFFGHLGTPYIIINQGVTRFFFSDQSYDKFLGSIC